MDEILRKLLESDLLSEETKATLTEQFKSAIEAYLTEERSKLEVEITSKLSEEFVKAQDVLVTKVNEKIDTVLGAEIDELKEDINKFRDLEVEYAEKLVEEKEVLAKQLGEEINTLVNKLDAFLEVRLDEEFAELKDDIVDVKKLEFGRKMFEAFESEFKLHRKADLDVTEQQLAETKDKLADAERKIAEIEASRLAEARSTKLEELLTSLSGNAKEQMKVILSNVATEKLEEAYKVYIGRILRETVAPAPKAVEKIVEGKIQEKALVPDSKVVTGNEEVVTEEIDVAASDRIQRYRKLAGLK